MEGSIIRWRTYRIGSVNAHQAAFTTKDLTYALQYWPSQCDDWNLSSKLDRGYFKIFSELILPMKTTHLNFKYWTISTMSY